jgi:hypothetical protein
MLLMVGGALAAYQDVVEIGHDVHVCQVPEDRIYQGLEDRGGIGNAKRHHQAIEAAIPGTDACLGDVLFTDLI